MEGVISNSMYAKHLDANDRLTHLLKNVTGIDESLCAPEKELNGIYWNADHFKLNQTTIYKNLNHDKKQQIISKLSQKNISLAYYIEKFGLNYGAKMIAAADSVEEKSLYTLFSADETKHRMMIEKFLEASFERDIRFHPLLPALELCLEKGSKEAMVYTIQVLLEGFGIFHYSYLRDSTCSVSLKNALNLILKDEAGHHGMGVILTERMELSKEAKEQILELTSMFVKSLLQASWLTQVVGEVDGGLSKEQQEKFHREIEYDAQLHQRKQKIRNLFNKTGSQNFIGYLEKNNIL